VSVAKEIGVKPLGVVVNMASNKKYEMTNREIEELTKIPVISKIPHDRNVHRSLTLKMPVVMFKPYSKASRELINLSSKLIGETYRVESRMNRILKKLRLK